MKEVFLDTGFILARNNPNDPNHAKAVRLEREVISSGARIVTTSAVLIEIGNALSKPRYRPVAIEIFGQLTGNAGVDVVHVSAALQREAEVLFASRSDKSWGMTDCISFAVMKQRGIAEALAGDEDFEQAGFVALLR